VFFQHLKKITSGLLLASLQEQATLQFPCSELLLATTALVFGGTEIDRRVAKRRVFHVDQREIDRVSMAGASKR
jgi:hypothetical protein